MKIATHNGVFHADDVLAISILYELDLVDKVVRTRDPAVVAACDMRVDVGTVYDHQKRSYDHHQQGGAGKRPNGIPYAALGLIWRHFGQKLAGSSAAFDLIDRTFIQPLDAEDNGLKSYRLVEEGLPVYSLGTAINRFNPNWDDAVRDFDANFQEAVTFGRAALRREIKYAQAQVQAATRVRAAIAAAQDPQVIVLDQRYPWQDIIIREAPQVRFVVYPGEDVPDWRVQVVPKALGTYEARRWLPAAWAGKHDAELAKITGVADATFCHSARFLAVAKTQEGILQLVNLALNN